MGNWQHFQDDEVVGLDPQLVGMLDKARGLAGIPFIITSGLRTSQDNQDVGGVQASAHLKGLAVDLRCDNSVDRYTMVKALLEAGFTRLGVYNLHVHCDRDDSLPHPVMWTGLSH